MENYYINAGYNGGSIDGYNTGTIEYCYSNSMVIGNGQNVGGIAGHNCKGTIRYCNNSGNIKSTLYSGMVGGVVGVMKERYCQIAVIQAQ